MYETSDFFYSIITFSCIKYFVHSYTVDVVFTLSDMKVDDLVPAEARASAAMISAPEGLRYIVPRFQ